MRRGRGGFTFLELMLGMAILSIMALAFSGLLRGSSRAVLKAQVESEAQEEARQGLSRLEEALAHANEITVSSASFVEFICDIENSPEFDPGGDADGDGVPNFRDADRDQDAALLLPATAQWRAGFNLKDDDEDGDGAVDMRRRIYLAQGEIRMDTRLNDEPWGGRVTRLMPHVLSFTLDYYGSKASSLGQSLDLGADGIAATADAGEGDGLITAVEMDMVPPPDGMGDQSGALDTANERKYIHSVRVTLEMDRNRDGRSDYAVETDVYPPLLPLKSQ